MKHIILEGPDGSGKTTLARTLEQRYGYAYVHRGVPPKRWKDLFHWYLDPLVERDGQPTVFDRLHLSETIYGPVMRGKSLISALEVRLIERWVDARDGQVVICLPPNRIAFKNWLGNRANEYVRTIDQFNAIYGGYANLLFDRNASRPYVRFDYTRTRAGTFAASLVKLEGHPLPVGVVGSQRPRFLFVGERCSGKLETPFLSPTNCSGWLNEVIAEAGYLEEELAFTNARRVNGRRNNLNEIVYELTRRGLTRIIALGGEAHRALESLKHTTLEHPQYWKRFHAKQRAAYVNRLRDIRRGSR